MSSGERLFASLPTGFSNSHVDMLCFDSNGGTTMTGGGVYRIFILERLLTNKRNAGKAAKTLI